MKNFTKQNFKTSPLWIRLLIMAFMVLAGVGNLSAAQYNIHWNGKVYFLAPETWNVDETYKYIQVDITRTTNATSSNHQEYIGNMTRLGTSRLFYVSVNANHTNWNQNEYIAFTANDHNYGSGSFRIDNNRYYTTPLNYGVKNGDYYLFKPDSKTELQTTTNANKITGIYASSRDDFKVDQTVQIYTNGSSSATGGTVKLTGYYLSSDNALSSSSATSSSTSAKFGSVPGTEMKLTATAKTGYRFDGWYTADTGGTKLSSDATYTYNVYEETTVYARFLSQEYTITYKDQGDANFSGIHANGYPTTHTYGTATTLKDPTKSGYNFLGWFTNSTCTGTEVTSLGATAYTANITLYAKWEQACTPANVTISDLSSTTLCTGGSLTFDYTAAAGANVTFKMGTNPNNFTVTGGGSNSGTVTITYNSTTSINSNAIKYDVLGTGICPLTDESTGKTIKCGPVPSIAATSATSFNFCPGDAAVTLSVTAGQGTYKWAKDGDVIAGKTTYSIEVDQAGIYTVYVVGTGGCQSNTVTFNVNGNGGPRVYASGSTTLGANKFAALYVTDCSGKEIKTYQWQSSSTQNGTYTDYAASVTNSGTLYSGDAGTTNNIRPATEGWYRCKVTYTDDSFLTSEAKQVTGTFSRLTSTLPVIIVNTNGVGFPVNDFGGTPSKNADEMKAKRSVDVKIYQGNTMVYDRKARMNYRGSSSLNFLKKSYAFCPGKDNCVEDKGRLDYVKTEKMNMLGIGTAKDKDWVLYAAAADPSLMRNRLMFDTFRDMTGGWSVNSRYVELYVDGEYKGVYVMMDKVTKNEGRVNITDPNGFIVKFDKTDLVDRYEADGDKKTFKSLYSGYDGESGNGMLTYDTYIDQRFEIEYPEMEDVEEDNPGMWAKTVNDIKTLFNNFESNLKAGNYAEVQKIIDYISWADWFIISEYAKNMDAYRASCLFVYNGGKIEARPLWDQELSFSNQCANLCATYGCNSTEGLLIENDKIYEEGCAPPFWFTGKYVGGRGTEAKSGAQFEGYLLNDPCFIAVLQERWELHTAEGGALTQQELKNKLDVYLAELDNQHQWGSTTIHSGTPLYREFYDFWGNNSYSKKSRTTIDCGTQGEGTCLPGKNTGYQDTGFHNSKVTMYNWTQGANDRRTRLGTIINNMEGSPLSISFVPQQVTTTPWEPITLQVVNPSAYDYSITYTDGADGALDQQPGVIIEKNDETYKINVPRPDKWGIGDEKVVDERADITYGIKATLNVADGTTVCGNSEVTPATATIILQDEPNEDRPQ